ncbi:hypothetical protein BCL52_2289 [Salisediminibacterium halotolerans]|uniref:Uncharacterized protein n=1 Tax=Salisediminibacterium halotolerans TaxID=517425 RepID=A0A1H9TGS2_9BACI|nr:hypothetical protein BCL39_2294 [Actinophytocola xinjiangensis]RPE85607.1 hypothetical protein EDD67_2428 [Salisediminibacterium halotolerans]TWG33561.1 hypothetical protein BCL52_2289 [Salisediminibacterium halotolerans]GEL08717.1 hypothetical protein SHA02_21330 [Salisediminibacterium halotolerans]SER96415.1 hypothetical protein SAMN05444126_11017 [Salisediminibacterium haloalkalitolerans]
MIYLPFIVFSTLYLFVINSMTNTLVVQKEIPEEKHGKIFRTINVLITILITSSFFRIFHT